PTPTAGTAHSGPPTAPSIPPPPTSGLPDPRLRDTSLPEPGSVPIHCSGCGRGVLDSRGRCDECGWSRPTDRDHVERAVCGVAGVSDQGLRHHRNEDAFRVSATALPNGTPVAIAVVCDGVSSSSRPHEASAVAAGVADEVLLSALPRGVPGREAMHEALLTAARAVNELAEREPEPIGRNAPACTIVGAVSVGGELIVGWVGDSRAYWVPMDGEGRPTRLTEDDSWAAQMVRAGLLGEEEAMADRRAHAITAWLGADNPRVEPHTATFAPDRPGVVVVCTDGLWNYADAADRMATVVPPQTRTAPLTGARQLVRYALDSGGHDNVTVAVIPLPLEAPAPPAPPGAGASSGSGMT
ncbi:PP2C family protein-serine/threonine phosphatase, partial [Streptomyces alkaliphilus]|uniref:PP2C family protein-serine/threonine phosphatase n=1 Tax=Streptomyces alkaliphilus TaxID=1472722 RepID=UPI001E31C5FE